MLNNFKSKIKKNIPSTLRLKKSCAILGVGFILTAPLFGCTRPSNSNIHVADFGYSQLGNTPTKIKGIGEIRLKAIEDTATSLGAQGALAWRSKQINAMLEKQADHLDTIFNFNQLVENHNLLPPVIVESDNNFQETSSNTLRLNQTTYQILQPSRFITVPPTWRDYLLMNFSLPEKPNNSLLPNNKAEIKVWNLYLIKGWKQGLTQANDIYQENINRLKRDINGMVLYEKLLEHKMIDAPYISKADLGVTGDSNKISIGDKIVRITKKSGLSTDSSKWDAILTANKQ